MVARPPELGVEAPEDGWLRAGSVRLDDGREAAVAFDRLGAAKLTVTLDRPVRAAHLDLLERAADLFWHVRLDDLDGGCDYPRRHAAAFGRGFPLPAQAFGRFLVVEVAAPAGGAPVPRRLGLFGAPAYQVITTDERGADGVPDGAAVAGSPAGRRHHEPAGGGADQAEQNGKGQDLNSQGRDGPVQDHVQDRNGQDGLAGGGPVTAPPEADGAGEGGAEVTGAAGAAPAAAVGKAAVGGAARAAEQAADVAADSAPEPAPERATGPRALAERVPVALRCQAALGAALGLFVVAFIWQTWTAHARFGTYGFDVGIFDQGTWLLSQGRDPFVTVRGLHLFGDHASYILVLVAPLYRLWSDPRLLLTLQVLGLAAPALAVYLLAGRRLGSPAAGLAFALAYLAYPAMQWAAVWQFHPETLAAGFLAGALVAAETRHGRLLATCLALALLCKEDVGLVVAGLGVTLWLAGQPRWGRRVLVAGLGYFLLATFVLIPLASGEGSPHFALNYGIRGDSLLATVLALPKLARQAFAFSLTDDGLRYLLLILVPLALLPLASWRQLAPVAGPIGLNLAAVHTYQHEIRYQYLATSSVFLVVAAAGGLAALRARHRSMLGIGCLVLLLAAGAMDYRYGPALWSRSPALGSVPAASAARYEALAMVGPDAGVSAQYHLIAQLTRREHAYEFPNPFIARNWGHAGDEPGEDAVAAVDYVIVEPRLLNPDVKIEKQAIELLDRLRRDPQWEPVYDNGGVLVLHRSGGTGNDSPPPTFQERP